MREEQVLQEDNSQIKIMMQAIKKKIVLKTTKTNLQLQKAKLQAYIIILTEHLRAILTKKPKKKPKFKQIKMF